MGRGIPPRSPLQKNNLNLLAGVDISNSERFLGKRGTDVKIVERKLEEITPYENNPRKNEMAVDAVMASIREFGFKVPVVIDKDGTIVAGHTRYKAAKRLKMTTIPCIIADDLSPEQIKAFRLADNKTGELAEWDFGMLGEELEGITDIDMNDFGFDMSALEGEPEAEEDEFSQEPPKEPKSKRGNLYKLGRHRLMCGDSTKRECVLKLVGGGGYGYAAY